MTLQEAVDVRCVWQADALLGEGAWWSAADRALYWVDIKAPSILRYAPSQDTREKWPSPEPIGCFAASEDGGFVGGFQSGICTFDLGPAGEQIKPDLVVRPEGYRKGDRFNDGKCHPDGSFWSCTMDDTESEARGHFYRLSANRELERISGPHMVCNGPAFSPDGRFAYLTDSARRTIYRIGLECRERQIETFAIFAEEDGYPDGMTTDSEGRLWIAFWDGWKVMCLATSGERLMEIRLPVARPTSCAFGGENLDQLYITSARTGLSENQIEAQPLAGSLFMCLIESANGWPAPTFR